MISIHLMLLFIIEPLLRMCMYMYFNTSHVTVYLRNNMCSRIKNSDFNTSHVTVYHEDLDGTIALYQFQYISCYCLSLSILLFYMFILHFNTSHVTVYRNESLSICKNCNISIHLMLLFITGAAEQMAATMKFQYISCYCLSKSKTCNVCIYRISIHLMLLFIVS